MTNSTNMSRVAWMALAMVSLLVPHGAGQAQEAGNTPAEPTPIDALALDQGKLADKYSRLEQLMIRMAEIEAATNPQRASLLKQAVQQSSERLTRQQLNVISRLLTPPAQLKRALDEQNSVVKDMEALLELLLSENRSDRLKDEQARVRQYIKQVERLIRQQRGVQGRTEGGDDADRLATDQERLASDTGDLAQQIRENEEGGQSPDGEGQTPEQGETGEPQEGEQPPKSEGEKGNPDGKPKDDPSKQQGQQQQGQQQQGQQQQGQQQQGQQQQGQQQQGQQQQGQQQQGQQQQGQQQQGQQQQGQQQQGQQQQGQQQQGQQQQGQQQQEPQGNPARQRLEEAQKRMQEAQKRLNESQRDEALEEQEAARQELEKAKAELEEILRQMREEELERTLAMLEARFRRMLEMQLRVHESTKKLDEIEDEKRQREFDIQASKLSFDENKLVVEAEKALLLLREEGSSVAFPETVDQMRDDMVQVVDRLSVAKVGEITQGYQEDIIAALEEMIEALQKAQQDLEQQQQQQQQQQQGAPQEMPLVDQLAEIKMIRALQMRINTRTQRYARMLADTDDPVGQAEDEELREALGNLSQKQQRVYRTTREIVLGKNR